MRKFIRQFYGNNKADSFKASKNWMAGFKARHNISLRRRTNKKAVGSMEMLPTLQNFHRQLKKDVNSGRGRDGGIKIRCGEGGYQRLAIMLIKYHYHSL